MSKMADSRALPASDPVILYDSIAGNGGHRADYYALLARLLGTKRTASFARALFSSRPVLVGALEASLPRYVLLCVWRSILGRNTAGLLFRPLQVIEGGSLRMRIKRACLSLLLRLPKVCTLTILPFSLDSRFSTIARSWIYDLQFWDLHYPSADMLVADDQDPIAGEIQRLASGRRVCCAIGRQDECKGFGKFAELYVAREDLRRAFVFAAGGEVAANMASHLRALTDAGAAVQARTISNEELLAMYACADLIWCCYDPDYDRASGVFGRAMQLGIPAIVRKGSLLHRFCLSEGIAHLAYDGSPETFEIACLPPRGDTEAAVRRAQGFGEESARRLRAALGMASPELEAPV